MKAQVLTLDNASAGEIELDDAVFGIAEIRPDILQRCVVWQLNKRRAGTHKVQTRNENARTGKKMYKQKGTGGARHGSRRAPQFVGGVRAFGPVVRSHATDLPKKVRALALKHALSSKAQGGGLVVLDEATLDSPKTAALRQRFGVLGFDKALIVTGAAVDANFGLAARNIPHIDVLPSVGLNVYDVLRCDTLVLTREAVDAVHARLGAQAGAAQQEVA